MSNNIILRNLIGLGLILGLLLPAQVVCPQNAVKAGDSTVAKPKAAPPPAPQKSTASDEDRRVTIEHADKMSYDPNTKTYHMTGNVVFANQSMRLFCDRADYNEENDSAKATGHLRVVDDNSVVTGDLLEADFGQELSVVTGNVKIVTQKKPNQTSGDKPGSALSKPKAGKPATGDAETNAVKAERSATAAKDKGEKDPEHVEDYWEKKTTITCERLEYYYSDDVKKMIATPRVKAVQEDKTVWADQAVFEDIPRLVTLTGNVVLNTEKGDEMRCTKAVVSVDEDWVQAENMSGVTLRKSKNGPAKPAAKPAEKPAERPVQKPAEQPTDTPKPADGAQPAPAVAPAPKPVEPAPATLQSQG
ncbi:MAG: OstA-like protein [Armatimonadota bacterium]